MNGKLTIKRLTASDLTLFEWHFRNRNAGNQKAINLNADVLVGQLFPSLEVAARQADGKLPLDMLIFGPGATPAINLQRKIIKHGEYKNWRLNGEFIVNPPDQPERFNVLAPGDFAVMALQGEIAPVSATVIFVAQGDATDRPLYRVLASLNWPERRTMLALSDVQLQDIIAKARLSADHPLVALSLSEELQEAAEGAAKARERLARAGRTLRLSVADFRRARDAAEETGNLGEGLVDVYLQFEKDAGRIVDKEWASKENVISPFDFRIITPDGEELVDVKTTTGGFERDLHISLAEVRVMFADARPYRLYRVYNATSDGATLRISAEMKPFAREVMGALAKLPPGVVADAISVEPARLTFGDPIVLKPPADED